MRLAVSPLASHFPSMHIAKRLPKCWSRMHKNLDLEMNLECSRQMEFDSGSPRMVKFIILVAPVATQSEIFRSKCHGCERYALSGAVILIKQKGKRL
jgi:hypothetical protein